MSLLEVRKLTATPPPAGFMKALTVWQSWASALIDGEKGNETRGYSIRYRGLLALHAAARQKNQDELDYVLCQNLYKQ